MKFHEGQTVFIKGVVTKVNMDDSSYSAITVGASKVHLAYGKFSKDGEFACDTKQDLLTLEEVKAIKEPKTWYYAICKNHKDQAPSITSLFESEDVMHGFLETVNTTVISEHTYTEGI